MAAASEVSSEDVVVVEVVAVEEFELLDEVLPHPHNDKIPEIIIDVISNFLMVASF